MISKLDEMAPKDSIIASNSSSYTISEIIAGLNMRDASRIVSAHSYWPPETAAIEIMGHEKTDPEVVSLLLDQCKRHNFSPFHVKKDSMGYIYNR
jgi:3-hydroxyacyl-CoA dehydrogenase